MMPTLYPDQVKAVLRACHAFEEGIIGLDELKAEIWKGAQAVVAVDEADFRRFLQAAEGRLDMIQVTTEHVNASARDIVREIQARVREHLA